MIEIELSEDLLKMLFSHRNLVCTQISMPRVKLTLSKELTPDKLAELVKWWRERV